MKKRLLILIIILIISTCLAVGDWCFMSFKNSGLSTISEAEAIGIIKNRFPELKDYPSDTAPAKIIKTKKTDEGWYVSFIQEGSDASIADARCYWVKENNKIMQRDYTPEDPAFVGEFSPEQCMLVGSGASRIVTN